MMLHEDVIRLQAHAIQHITRNHMEFIGISVAQQPLDLIYNHKTCVMQRVHVENELQT